MKRDYFFITQTRMCFIPSFLNAVERPRSKLVPDVNYVIAAINNQSLTRLSILSLLMRDNEIKAW